MRRFMKIRRWLTAAVRHALLDLPLVARSPTRGCASAGDHSTSAAADNTSIIESKPKPISAVGFVSVKPVVWHTYAMWPPHTHAVQSRRARLNEVPS